MSYLRFALISCTVAFLVFLNSCNNSTQVNTSTDESSVAVEENTVQDTTFKDNDYMTTLGLMKGHLMVGQELLEQKLADQAEPHMGHPIEELYGDIEAELPERGVEDFKPDLNQLHDIVATAPEAPEIPEQYATVIQKIDQAIAILPETKSQSPKFVLDSINGILATADEEYAAGILDGKIVEIIEYQDSRGFVNYVENLYQTIAEQMQQNHPEAHQTIAANIDQLKQAWPSAIAPEQATMTPEQVNQLVAQIEQSSNSI